jgi:hypothetical protein
MPDNILLGNGQKAATSIAANGSAQAHVTLVEFVTTTGAEDARTTTKNPTLPVSVVATTLLPTLATTDNIGAVPTTGIVMEGTTALTVKFAAGNASSSGNNTLVAAVTGKRIRVLKYSLVGNGAVNATFQSGAGGAAISGTKYIDAQGRGIVADGGSLGVFQTASGALLNLSLSAAVSVGWDLTYIEVNP